MVNYFVSDWLSSYDDNGRKKLQTAHYEMRRAEDFFGKRKKFTHKRVATKTRVTRKRFRDVCDHQLELLNEAEGLDPHFGLESIPTATFALDALARFSGVDIPSVALREIEGMILLLTNLSQQETPLGVISSILLYLQGRTTKALFTHVKDFIEDLLIVEQNDGIPEWLVCLRNIRENWMLCRHNRAFKQISKLIGLLCIMGLCEASDLTFSVKQFKVFEPDLLDKHTNAFDLIDAMFETVMFFTEGIYMCFKTGSIKPLLVNDRTAMELDAEFTEVSMLWEYVKNGNLKKFKDMEDADFEKRLNSLCTSLKSVAMTLKGLDKRLVEQKYMKIVVIQSEYVAKKISSGLRHAPFGLEFFGRSSQGKTQCADQVISALQVSQGMSSSKETRCAYNPGDKHMSNWTTDKTVIIFDDVANEKGDFVERPPTRAIIDVINNQMYYAPKAELDAKGKCFVEPWIAIVTTNKKDMDASTYSHCPYSVQRRVYCITIAAKEQFQKLVNGKYCGVDDEKVDAFYTDEKGNEIPHNFDDIWDITVEVAVEPEKLTTVAKYSPVTWRDTELVNIKMDTLVNWACEAFDKHRKHQFRLLERARKREHDLKRCISSGCVFIAGTCPDHDVIDLCQPCEVVHEPHFGIESATSAVKVFTETKARMLPDPDAVRKKLDDKASQLLYDTLSEYTQSWEWIQLVPNPALNDPKNREIIQWWYNDRIEQDALSASRKLWFDAFWISLMSWLLFGKFGIPIFIIAVLKSIWCQQFIVEKVEDELMEELNEHNVNIHPLLKKYRDGYAHTICKAFIAIGAVYGLATAYRAYRSSREVQGSLEPKTQEDIDQRDAEKDVYTQVVVRDLPIAEKSKTATLSELETVVEKNLVYGSIHLNDGEAARVNGLFLSSNVILIPHHYFSQYGDTLNCTFRKRNPETSGGKFATRLSIKASYHVPDSDLRLCYSSTGGSFKNLVDYFPTAEMPSVPFSLTWRGKDGVIVRGHGTTSPGKATTYTTFKGGHYESLSMNTFGGLCGAPLISQTKGVAIIGVHLGGTAGTPKGCYGSLIQSEINDAFAALRKIPGVALTGGAGDFRNVVYDVQVTLPDPLHPKSPLNYLPENSQIEYYGSVVGRHSTKSDVRVSCISEYVLDVCNVPNIYCAPKMNPEWFGWQTCLANLAVPALPFDHEVLILAVEDYKEPLIELVQSDLWNGTRPLTDKENLCGIAGKRFVDAIKLGTSGGIGLRGKKRDHVLDLEPIEGFPNNRELEQQVMDEIRYAENEYRAGRRYYPIAKACKKDEILTKDKCRIFYGNALSLTWLIRKWYLPIMRILQMNPLISECAVGINAHSEEWDQFHHHARKFGEDRLLGGDYGKYDQKLPAQLIIAAMKILIDLAAQLPGYTTDDLRIMEAMIGDVVYSYIAFNGDLVGLTEGTHISGNSLTVIINGICGSLNLRCAFYTFNPTPSFEERKVFREWVALMTYGDDNIGSVRTGCDNFNIKTVSEFLGEFGQTYTMPDKESELTPYLKPDEFEFLKRKSVYHPDLECHVGALLDKSIYKSLHMVMRTKKNPLTMEQACAQNIDTALFEWFNHGEEKYETQRALMTKVAERAGIRHMCRRLDSTYQDGVQNWLDNYKPHLGEGAPSFKSDG